MSSTTDRATEALRAAGIDVERCGQERLARLSEAERRCYLWIIQGFARAAPPSGAATRKAAEGFGLDPDQLLETLACEDLVHTGWDGRPVVAYPFSANQRGHRVLIDGVNEVQAMCAIDALGIAAMLDRAIDIVSHDPISGSLIRVQLDPTTGSASWWPEGAVILAGSSCCGGPSFTGCCDVLNFFETNESAEHFLLEHTALNGIVISIPEATEAGRAIFGDVLKDD